MEDKWRGSLDYSDYSGQNNSLGQQKINSNHSKFNTLPKTFILISPSANLNHDGEKLFEILSTLKFL